MSSREESQKVACWHSKLRKALLLCVTLGMYEEPFDRKKFAQETFGTFAHAFMCMGSKNPERDIAKALQQANEQERINYEETKHSLRVANRRAILAVWLAVLSLICSVIVGLRGIKQAHEDSESTTRALVEAIESLRK